MTLPINVNTKILLSGAAVFAAAALIIGATFAFFSDTETSTGNIFTAGAIDLKVDSECRRYEFVGIDADTQDGTPDGYIEVGCDDETPEFGTWSEDDLELGVHKFFNFSDVKPGDKGEDTISLHVYTNDAWGRLVIDNLVDDDVDCTEPESEDPDDPSCTPNGTIGDGELQEALSFFVWLDQGVTPGFQGTEDEGEGDNIQQQGEPTFITPGPINDPSETWNIWEGLAPYRAALDTGNVCDATDSDGDGQTDNDGTPSEDDYLACQGIAVDGRLVGSTTYYFGVAWELPSGTGNEAQGDSFGGDMSLQVVQHRNNPTQTF